MKKQLLLLGMMLLPMVASAYDAYIDGIYYNLNQDNKTAEVTYKSQVQMSNRNLNKDAYSGEVVIPAELAYNEVTYSVTSIGYKAFGGCSDLISITIPNSVTSIGNSAFGGCSNLQFVELHCREIETWLSGFSSIEKLIIGDEVISIGERAFQGCSGLKSVTIGNSVTTIGYSAFKGCNSLTSITIPNSVTTIGDETFYNCSGLTSVTMGNGVTTIGSSAFQYCRGLTSITIPDSVTSIRSSTFYGCSSLNSLTIPNGVTSLGSSAFTYCRALASATIGDGVTSIGNNTFYWCTALSSVIIGNGVTSIGNEAFYECDALTSVTIGSGVTYIGERAFYYCRDLTDVYCYAENAPSTYSDTFILGYLKNATLHVPSASINVYKSTYPWRSFGSIVKIDMPKHTLTYMVDGEVYKTYSIEEGETITPEPAPIKEGYTFSGWSEIPETMPDHDVVVYASFTSGIAEILMTTQRNIRIYSPDGKKRDKPQNGLNIVIFDDGTIKKIMVK